MRNIKKAILLNAFIYSLSFSQEIVNTIILDNPKKAVTTVETIKKKEKAELNLNIKKISSNILDGYVSKKKNLISFVLDELTPEDLFYLSDNKIFFNEHTRKVQENSNSYELKKIDFMTKSVTFTYKALPKELYLVKYDIKTKELKKLYKWEEKNSKYIDSQNGSLSFAFTEEYKPFEIVRFSTKRIANIKGNLNIRSGSYININPLLSKEIVIKNSKGEILQNIALKNGIGFFKLDDSKKGLILENGSSILNFGIGFEENETLLQIKGTTDSTKEYFMTLEVINLDETIQSYDVNIKPAKYALKILNKALDFDFTTPEVQNKYNLKDAKELISKSEIQIDTKGLNIKTEFANNGIIKLKNGETIINGKLEAILDNNTPVGDIKTLHVIGKVKKEDILNMPSGDYIGSAELIITIDS